MGGTGSAGSARTGFAGACGHRGERQPAEQRMSPGQSSHRAQRSDQPAMRPKRLWQRPFRRLRAQHGGAVGTGQQLARDGVHLVERDLVDLAEGVLDAAVFAVVELAAADAVHPRTGILEPEHQPAAQRTLGDPAFRFGDAVAGRPSPAPRWSPGPPRRNVRAGTPRRSTALRCRRRCPPSSTPSTPVRAFPESVGTDANSGRRRARC